MPQVREKKFQVERESKGLRLDKYLSFKFKDFSRSYIQKLIKQKKVKVNSLYLESSYRLREGDLVDVILEEKKPFRIPLVALKISVIYEDEDIIVVDKPEGLIVHPVYKSSDSLIGAILYRGVNLSEVSPLRPGVVHRLDKDTSGVMVLAKNNYSHLELLKQFKERKIEKEYVALVRGLFKEKKGKINLPLKRLKYKPKMKVSFIGAKKSLTFYEVLEERGNISFIQLKPKTGRMHQLRVHLSFLGHPVIGDKKYKGPQAERLFLHSRKLGLFHPAKKEFVEFNSPLPSLFKDYLNSLNGTK